jgi:Mg2+/Co2+ transporter CorB
MAVVAMGEKEGAILSKESDLIENLLKLKNIKAKDIMTPRSVVFAYLHRQPLKMPSKMTVCTFTHVSLFLAKHLMMLSVLFLTNAS